MSASAGGDSNQDFDLNLAPIIDCFTVLITYLLVSASFISLTILDVGVAASGVGTPPPSNAVPPPTLTINLTTDNRIDLKLTGGPKKLSISQSLEVTGLTKKCTELLRSYPDIKDVTLFAQPTVSYRNVVRVIEEVKKVIPKVYLTG